MTNDHNIVISALKSLPKEAHPSYVVEALNRIEKREHEAYLQGIRDSLNAIEGYVGFDFVVDKVRELLSQETQKKLCSKK